MQASDLSVVVITVVVLLVVFLIPLTITGLKGKTGMLPLGLLFHPIWWVAAIRLAKPNSWWARRFYDESKLARAQARFPQAQTKVERTEDRLIR